MIAPWSASSPPILLPFAIDVPDAHSRAGNGRQLDSARETLVTLRVIILQADLEFNGLEKISLLGVVGVIQQLLNILAHASYSEFISPLQRLAGFN